MTHVHLDVTATPRAEGALVSLAEAAHGGFGGWRHPGELGMMAT